MNVSSRMIGAALAATLCLAGTSAIAQEKQPPNRGAAAAATDASRAVEDASTAIGLVAYGDANKDPLALITAARILKSIGSRPSDAKRVAGTPGPDKGAADADSVDAILARARTLAAGRADLLALADDVAKASSRGVDGGPKSLITVVRTRAVDVYQVVFRGGEPARVFVTGDGDSDLDLYVYDQHGNLICKDDDHTDRMVCGWTPRWTGSFTIRVRNLGVANRYRIWTN